MARSLKNPKRVKRGRIPRPFVKWVGGKSQILGAIGTLFPKTYSSYHEPFVGGGAVFFDLLPERAILSDSNRELINCYEVIRSDVEALVESLKTHVYEKEWYYRVREQDPDGMDAVSRAARTIFLNRTGFNGLFRVNSKGKFNVPFGRYKNPKICDEANLRGCSDVLENVSLRCSSFESVLVDAKKGDFVYFDPPYIPVSDTAYFTAYQKRGFGMENQEKLAEVFEKLDGAGVKVLLSNSAVPWMFSRYKDFKVRTVNALRSINSNKSRRGAVKEVLVSNF